MVYQLPEDQEENHLEVEGRLLLSLGLKRYLQSLVSWLKFQPNHVMEDTILTFIGRAN